MDARSWMDARLTLQIQMQLTTCQDHPLNAEERENAR